MISEESKHLPEDYQVKYEQLKLLDYKMTHDLSFSYPSKIRINYKFNDKLIFSILSVCYGDRDEMQNIANNLSIVAIDFVIDNLKDKIDED